MFIAQELIWYIYIFMVYSYIFILFVHSFIYCIECMTTMSKKMGHTIKEVTTQCALALMKNANDIKSSIFYSS